MKLSLSDKILNCLKKEKELTLADFAKKLKISRSKISTALIYLVYTGKVKRELRVYNNDVVFFYYMA